MSACPRPIANQRKVEVRVDGRRTIEWTESIIVDTECQHFGKAGVVVYGVNEDIGKTNLWFRRKKLNWW